MTAAPVLVSRDARGVVQVVLNRPAVNNACDSAMIDGWLNAGASARRGAEAGGSAALRASADVNAPRPLAAPEMSAANRLARCGAPASDSTDLFRHAPPRGAWIGVLRGHMA